MKFTIALSRHGLAAWWKRALWSETLTGKKALPAMSYAAFCEFHRSHLHDITAMIIAQQIAAIWLFHLSLPQEPWCTVCCCCLAEQSCPILLRPHGL